MVINFGNWNFSNNLLFDGWGCIIVLSVSYFKNNGQVFAKFSCRAQGNHVRLTLKQKIMRNAKPHFLTNVIIGNKRKRTEWTKNWTIYYVLFCLQCHKTLGLLNPHWVWIFAAPLIYKFNKVACLFLAFSNEVYGIANSIRKTSCAWKVKTVSDSMRSLLYLPWYTSTLVYLIFGFKRVSHSIPILNLWFLYVKHHHTLILQFV